MGTSFHFVEYGDIDRRRPKQSERALGLYVEAHGIEFDQSLGDE